MRDETSTQTSEMIRNYAEWAAKWHDEWAANYRHVAQITRDERSGPDLSFEDNLANHADYREYYRKAADHEKNARAFRSMIHDPNLDDAAAEMIPHCDTSALNIVNQIWAIPSDWHPTRRKAHAQILIGVALKAAAHSSSDPYKVGKEWCPVCHHDDGAHDPSCKYADQKDASNAR